MTLGLVRGCGTRVVGQIYAMSEVVDEGGTPWEHFMLCPTLPVDAEVMGISNQGVTMILNDLGTAYNLWDVIGKTHYPCAADYVEEGIRYSFSALIPRQKSILEKITPESRRILLHHEAHLLNANRFYPERARAWCPSQDGAVHAAHLAATGDSFYTCAGLLWEMMAPGKFTAQPDKAKREVVRHLPAFTYEAWTPPAGVEPETALAAFMWLPIHHWEVVMDEGPEQLHQRALDLLGQADTGLAVKVVAE